MSCFGGTFSHLWWKWCLAEVSDVSKRAGHWKPSGTEQRSIKRRSVWDLAASNGEKASCEKKQTMQVVIPHPWCPLDDTSASRQSWLLSNISYFPFLGAIFTFGWPTNLRHTNAQNISTAPTTNAHRRRNLKVKFEKNKKLIWNFSGWGQTSCFDSQAVCWTSTLRWCARSSRGDPFTCSQPIHLRASLPFTF